jgi:hypothetical protein
MLRHLFLDHPRTVGESYLGHLRFAAGFAGLLLLAAGAALVHALVPALCAHTASGIVRDLEARTRGRRPVAGPVVR